jgi:hypothetical protein
MSATRDTISGSSHGAVMSSVLSCMTRMYTAPSCRSLRSVCAAGTHDETHNGHSCAVPPGFPRKAAQQLRCNLCAPQRGAEMPRRARRYEATQQPESKTIVKRHERRKELAIGRKAVLFCRIADCRSSRSLRGSARHRFASATRSSCSRICATQPTNLGSVHLTLASPRRCAQAH